MVVVGHAREENGAAAVKPTYVMAEVPGETTPEFLLMTPFTPHNKNNLIGLMEARCDGDRLGAWLATTTRREALALLRRSKRDIPVEDAGLASDAPPLLWHDRGFRGLSSQ